MRSYNTRLSFESQEEFQRVLDFLKAQRDCVNACFIKAFDLEKLSIVDLHHKFYREYRDNNSVPSQLIIRAQKEVLGDYRSMKSNNIAKVIPQKKALSTRLDKHIYLLKGSTIRLTTLGKRVAAKINLYPRLEEMLNAQDPCDPLIFEKNGEIWISFTFEDPEVKFTPRLAVGIDLGVRRLVATSEGKLFIDKDFNRRIRKIRKNKRTLQSKGSKNARRKLRKISKREGRMKRQLLHTLANQLLQTPANVLVLEDLTKIKFKVKIL